MAAATDAAPPVPTWQRAISASMGAIVTNLFATPLDVVKTRMQTVSPSRGTVAAAAAPDASAPPAKACCARTGPGAQQTAARPCVQKRRVCAHPAECTARCVDECRRPACRVALARVRWQASTLGTLSHLARTEGLRSLWAGLSPALVMSIPSTALYFTSYDELKRILTGAMGGWATVAGVPLAALTAGAAARTVAAAVISPLELIRTKMQSSNATYGIVAGIRADMAEHGGVRGLWRGLGPTLWRDVPFSALYWGGVEMTRTALAPSLLPTDGTAPSAGQHFALAFASGSISGSFAATVTTPFDVVKTKRQAAMYGDAATTDAVEVAARRRGAIGGTTNTLGILRHILAAEGAGGMFVGLLPRVAKVAPSCAIMISSYEMGKHFFAAAAAAEAEEWSDEAGAAAAELEGV